MARLACSPLVRVGLALLSHVVGSGLTEMEPPHGHLCDLLRGKIDPAEDGQRAQGTERVCEEPCCSAAAQPQANAQPQAKRLPVSLASSKMGPSRLHPHRAGYSRDRVEGPLASV